MLKKKPVKIGPRKRSFGAILWNTSKFCHSLEQRHKKMFGKRERGTLKIMAPKRWLCNNHETGEDFELGKLPPERYCHTTEETREIQERMGRAFGDGPQGQEGGRRLQGEAGQIRGRMQLVEMEKERPLFFSPSLMQKANRTPATKARNE